MKLGEGEFLLSISELLEGSIALRSDDATFGSLRNGDLVLEVFLPNEQYFFGSSQGNLNQTNVQDFLLGFDSSSSLWESSIVPSIVSNLDERFISNSDHVITIRVPATDASSDSSFCLQLTNPDYFIVPFVSFTSNELCLEEGSGDESSDSSFTYSVTSFSPISPADSPGLSSFTFSSTDQSDSKSSSSSSEASMASLSFVGLLVCLFAFYKRLKSN